jgi:replication initiation and membrane attachment protein DnaB
VEQTPAAEPAEGETPIVEAPKPQEQPAADRYSLSPVSFLQSFQNGAQVTRAEKKILEHLSMDMNFSNEVINVMIEYILKISSNRLNSKFVDAVASEWARDGISTKEQALRETKKKAVSGGTNRGRVVPTPKMFTEEKETETREDPEKSRDMIDEIRAMQEKIKE